MFATKNNRIPKSLQPYSLLPHRRRQGRCVAFSDKPYCTYDYNVWIRKVLDSNGDGTADSKTIFIPENYQTTVQLDDANLTDTNSPAITHHYLWTPNQQDKLLADTTSSEILWSLTDHLGTIRDIVQQTSSGLVVPAHIIYDAYGNIISCTDSTGQPISTPLLFAYTGKAFDTSTSLQNNINRWYDSTTGRWLSTDPIGFEGNDTNLYRYVKNQTCVDIDVMGLASKNAQDATPEAQEIMEQRSALIKYLKQQKGITLISRERGGYILKSVKPLQNGKYEYIFREIENIAEQDDEFMFWKIKRNGNAYIPKSNPNSLVPYPQSGSKIKVDLKYRICGTWHIHPSKTGSAWPSEDDCMASKDEHLPGFMLYYGGEVNGNGTKWFIFITDIDGKEIDLTEVPLNKIL